MDTPSAWTRRFAYTSAALWLVAFCMAALIYLQGFLPVHIVNADSCRATADGRVICDGSVNAVSVALQLGRLDLVTLALTILAAVIGLVGFFGYLGIRERTELIAGNIAKDRADHWMEHYRTREIPQQVARAADSLITNVYEDAIEDDDAKNIGDKLGDDDG